MIGKQTLIVVIITFATVVAWAAVDIIQQSNAVKVPDEIQQLLEPISPNFDLSGIK